jgi:putative flavoprotein involved in K+ transport
MVDWLAMYTKVIELNYWTSTTAKCVSSNEAPKEWTAFFKRDGEEIRLPPKQLMFATGM